MTKITLEDFIKKVESDEALSAKIRASSDPDAALQALIQLAAEMGFELDMSSPVASQALSDDDLSSVTGGVNLFIPQGDGELNPYSWFVTLLRRLLDLDKNSDRPSVPEIRVPGVNGQ